MVVVPQGTSSRRAGEHARFRRRCTIDTEIKAPLTILGVSLLAFAIGGFSIGGAEGAGHTLAAVAISLVFNIVLGVVALYIAAAVLQINYGNLGTAVLKLAAIFSAPAAAGLLIPIEIVALIVSVVVYWALLAWLFALDARELIISVVILFVVRLIGGFLAAVIVVGVLG